jgi:hypothetical protein
MRNIFAALTGLCLLAPNGYAEGQDDRLNLGIGVGIPFGILGVNANWMLSDHVDGTIGLGVYGPSVGARVYPLGGTDGFRASLVYGTHTAIETTECSYTCESETEEFQGLNLGLGYGTRGPHSGWDIDILLVLTDGGAEDRIDELKEQGYEGEDQFNPISFSFGYHW